MEQAARGYVIKDEFHPKLKHTKGRYPWQMQDQHGGSQFFINERTTNPTLTDTIPFRTGH